MGSQLGQGNIPWYSALDQFMTSQHMKGSSDWAMITPLSQIELNQAFRSNGLMLSQRTQEMFTSLGVQKNMNALMHNKGLSNSSTKAMQSQSDRHQNIKSDSNVAQRGQWRGWTFSFDMSGFTTDSNYQQDVVGKTTGLSYDLSAGHMVGYQFSAIDQSYYAIDKTSQGTVKSQIAQGHSYTMLGNMQIQTNVIAAAHESSHSREIDVMMDEYVKEWTANSQQDIKELRFDQTAMLDTAVSKQFHVSAGAQYQGQYLGYAGYTETGAEDLNLTVKPYGTLNAWIHPMMAVSYHQAQDNIWSYMRATVGYQQRLASNTELNYGFEAYEGQISMPLAQAASSAYTLGLETALGSSNGLSVMASSKVAYHAEGAPIECQGNLSLVWAF